MFAKKFRLPAAISFSQAQIISSSFFSGKIKKNNLPYNRYGFIVSKRISKRAHVRNRAKRVFRSCIEKLHYRLNGGYDMLFVLKPTTTGRSFETLCAELTKILAPWLVE